MGIIDNWKLSKEELNEIMEENPSLRGFTFGYVCEYKAKKLWFSDNRVSNVKKHDDHDRKHKGDISFFYKGFPFNIEVKSLQTNTIKKSDNTFSAKFQCDASDSREVILPNGEIVKTTCLLVGEFDLLAVSLFQFKNEWLFAFAKNKDLPRSNYKGYTPGQRQYLLATSMSIQVPFDSPYYPDPFPLLDQLIAVQQPQ